MAEGRSADGRGAKRIRRLVYTAGPGDVIGTYGYWRQGQDDPSQTSLTYSSYFYDLCRELDIEALVIATRSPAALLKDGRIRVEHRPVWWTDRAGALYHLGQIGFKLSVVISAILFRPAAVVVTDSYYLFALAPLRLFGVNIIPSLHGALWPVRNRNRRVVARYVLKLDGWFFRHHASATICVSPECERQVRELSHSLSGPVYQSRAQYRRADFDRVNQPQFDGNLPFRMLFAGRIERNKGVFDLVDVAIELERRRAGLCEWHVCGTGSAEAELKDVVADAGLAGIVHCRGQANRQALLEEFSWSNALLVPTTKDFNEGLNKVAVESILAGRPLVTTELSNAVELLGDAVVEIEPGDIQGYADAIERLASDREYYERKRRACVPARGQFLDPERSWGSALRRALFGPSALGSDMVRKIPYPTHARQ